MTQPIDAADAGRALDEIARRRRQIISEIDVPAWYWWGLALGWIALGIVTDAAGAPEPALLASVAVAVIVLTVGPQLMALLRRRAARREHA